MQVTRFNQVGEKDPKVFSLGDECQKDGILECCVFSEGVVALTTKFALWAITDLQDPRPQKLARPKMDHAPKAIAVVEPSCTLSGSVEVDILKAYFPYLFGR